MPIDDSKSRAYDPAQDPTNPVSPPPKWQKSVAAVLATVAAVLVAIQDQELFPPDSQWGKLVAIGIKALAAIGPMLLFMHGETRKEVASIEQAGAIKVAEATPAAVVPVVPVAVPTVTPQTSGDMKHGTE